MKHNVVDLEGLALDWADSNQIEGHQGAVKASDLDWSKLKITHEPAKYTNHVQSAPKAHTISTCYFTNKTSQPQTFRLRMQRRTKSTCTLSMSRVFTIGSHVDIQLSPPNPLIQIRAGFTEDLSVTHENDTTVEEINVWSVDSEVNVPANTRTKAELLLSEVDYSSNFSCKTKFENCVAVKRNNKKGKGDVSSVALSLNDMILPAPGFVVEGTAVYFISTGTCRSKFGLEQSVKLSETSIND